jgi:hypothetical protein
MLNLNWLRPKNLNLIRGKKLGEATIQRYQATVKENGARIINFNRQTLYTVYQL